MTASLQLASLHLRVPDLARSVEFYAGKLGFVVVARDTTHAELATSPSDLPAGALAKEGASAPEGMPGAPAILTLTEDRAAPSAPRDAAGLFHAALLLPSRTALGGWLRHAAAHGVEFDGFSDHGVSEAIYFSDPDGNGLEFYADRPRDTWPFAANGEIAMGTRPLALPGLLAAAPPAGAAPLAGARWGHLHLRVTDLDRSEKFYRDSLGVAVTQRSYPGARFLAADGYHHHLGLNTWGHPRAPRPPAALGLAGATFARAGVTGTQTVRDPDGIVLRIVEL
jgi:catechol 2,3-dioxygenase